MELEWGFAHHWVNCDGAALQGVGDLEPRLDPVRGGVRPDEGHQDVAGIQVREVLADQLRVEVGHQIGCPQQVVGRQMGQRWPEPVNEALGARWLLKAEMRLRKLRLLPVAPSRRRLAAQQVNVGEERRGDGFNLPTAGGSQADGHVDRIVGIVDVAA